MSSRIVLARPNPIEERFRTVTKYHIYYFSLYFFSRLAVIWHLLNFLFLIPPLHYTCNTSNSNGTTGVEDGCPCDKPIWDKSVFSKTIQMKYGILCDTKWLLSTSDTIYVFGMLIGSVAFGAMSDKYGRLLTFAVSSTMTGICGCLVTVMPDIATFMLMRILEGVGLAGVITASYVLAIEFCGVNYRETVSAILHFPINVGHMLVAVISYFIRDCDDFQIVVSVPMFIPGIFWFVFLESPKWMLDSNQRERAIKTMEKFCKFNKGPHCETVRAELESYEVTGSGEALRFHQLLKHKKMAKNVLCMGYISFTCGLGYYGVTEFIGRMTKDIHLNTLIGGSFLVPGTIVSVILLNKLRRKTFVLFTCITAGVMIFVVVLIPVTFKPHWVRTIFAGIANSTFYMLFIVVFLYCMELFPTSARNSALGFVSVMSRVGQMLGPQINRFSLIVSGTIFGIMSLLCALVVVPMPETKGRDLPSGAGDVVVVGASDAAGKPRTKS